MPSHPLPPLTPRRPQEGGADPATPAAPQPDADGRVYLDDTNSGWSSGPKKDVMSDEMKRKLRAEYIGLGGSPNKKMSSKYFLNIVLIVAFLVVLCLRQGLLG